MLILADAEWFDFSWHWWVLAGAIVLLLLISAIRPRLIGSGENMVATAVVPDDPLRKALILIRRGNIAGSCEVLEQAAAHFPPTDACSGEEAIVRFKVLMLLADLIKKSKGDFRRELDLLNECLPLVKHLPADPAGPDYQVNLRYLLHMNRGVAASILGLCDQSIPAYRDALRAARQPESRCKCLVYLGGDLLRLKDRAKLTEVSAIIEQFHRESGENAIATSLRARALQCRAILHLDANNVAAARRLLEQAMEIESPPRRQITRDLLSLQQMTADPVIDYLLGYPTGPLPNEGRGMRQAGAGPMQTLPPLADDL